MKKWTAYILCFYILLSTVVPCSIFDKCEDEQLKEQSSHKEQKKDCNGCSPFSICSSAYGFTVTATDTQIEPTVFCNSAAFDEYLFPSKSEYFSSLFQPPRTA